MFEVSSHHIARPTDKMWHFVISRILGLDEQYLTDLAQYQCQAARLRARRGHQCGAQPPAQGGPWSLVDRWKPGKKSVSQVRLFELRLRWHITIPCVSHQFRIPKTQISAGKLPQFMRDLDGSLQEQILCKIYQQNYLCEETFQLFTSLLSSW